MIQTGTIQPQATLSNSRTYWIYQYGGWIGFATYIAGSYVVFAPSWQPSVVASMLLFNAVVCPVATHLLRAWILRHGWLALSWRPLAARAIIAVALLAAILAAMVGVVDVAMNGRLSMEAVGLFWTFFGFIWAVGGWLSIYVMVQVRRKRERIALELTVLAREAQLDALRAQVNPHFLFNCLNSLRALVVQDPERAVGMITALSDLLRYALTSDRRRVVPLAEELVVVNEYLKLEGVRFEEKLQVERRIEETALPLTVPPLLVQTLVENAVKHGISRQPRGGSITIEAKIIDKTLSI
ncbi:MAG: histidine kinase, partial [Acidobacteriaceae bacterium]|nr:histidine kinase [Acidobacteriaceae bacterium]